RRMLVSLALEGAGREAADEVPLEIGEEDGDGHGGDHDARRELAPLDLVLTTMNRRPAESVRISVCVVNVIANKSSLQDVTKAKIAVAAMPGAASGSTMRHSAPKRPQPSMSALSSRSRGIASKYPTSIQTVNGTV